MTEAEWLACADVLELLAQPVATAKRGRRRLRLFGVACCRQLGRWIVNDRLWECLDAAERYADGKLEDAGLERWTAEANKAWIACNHSPARVRQKNAVLRTHHAVAYTCLADRYGSTGSAARIILEAGRDYGGPFVQEMRALFPALFRDVFGDPFRAARIERRWRTADVMGLAEEIYEDRAFDRVPILGDALQDSGCDDEQVLAHCREGGPHVRGCWVVDLVLGTEGPYEPRAPTGR